MLEREGVTCGGASGILQELGETLLLLAVSLGTLCVRRCASVLCFCVFVLSAELTADRSVKS